ncbi:hypothetical protein R1sor_021010 [Riccia sorocarpa]|uniref:Late embryogenesis abundant protein n=1 Tax=Riccia sorocarpa TaxID=122646 RepID=A0ABD3GK13_9MARC
MAEQMELCLGDIVTPDVQQAAEEAFTVAQQFVARREMSKGVVKPSVVSTLPTASLTDAVLVTVPEATQPVVEVREEGVEEGATAITGEVKDGDASPKDSTPLKDLAQLVIETGDVVDQLQEENAPSTVERTVTNTEPEKWPQQSVKDWSIPRLFPSGRTTPEANPPVNPAPTAAPSPKTSGDEPRRTEQMPPPPDRV